MPTVVDQVGGSPGKNIALPLLPPVRLPAAIVRCGSAVTPTPSQPCEMIVLA